MAQLGVMTTEFDTDAPSATDTGDGSVVPAFADTADRIAGAGLRWVQLQLGSLVREVPTSAALLHGLDVLGDRLDEDLAATAHQVLVDRGIEVAAVDGTYNMAHPDRSRRERNLDHLLALIELAPRFGTDVVTLCTGSRDDTMWYPHEANASDAAWADLLAQLRVAAPVAERAGVRLAFEPEHNNVVDSARRARRLIDEVDSPALKVLLDAANIFHRGELARMQDHLTEAFALVGHDVVLAHAKDLDHDGDAGGRAAGQGLLDYTCYLTLLQESGFDGAVVLHGLGELAPDRFDEAFAHVRSHAPAGYLT